MGSGGNSYAHPAGPREVGFSVENSRDFFFGEASVFPYSPNILQGKVGLFQDDSVERGKNLELMGYPKKVC